MKKKYQILLSFFFISQISFAQEKTNLELINELIDTSTSKIVYNLSDLTSNQKLNINYPQEFSFLSHRVSNSFVRNGVKLNLDSTATTIINYSFSNVKVEYSNLFKDGLFGSYLMERKVTLSGDFSIQKSNLIANSDVFSFSAVDTIAYDNYYNLENSSLPFTKGKIPEPPFFPSILEPAIAITTVAVSVILFFSVRTK